MAAPMFSYGLLRMPLALMELPLFLLVPAFYHQQTGIGLALIGSILFAGRLLDAVADPLIGAGIDRTRLSVGPRRWILLGMAAMSVGFVLLFLPPARGAAAWLALTSMLTYLAYSCVSIAYQAWGAAIGTDVTSRARVTGTREAFGLVGVIAASAMLSPERVGLLLAIFLALAALASFAIARLPLPQAWARPVAADEPPGRSARWRDVMANPGFRRLLLVFVLNGTATAIPATLALFFMRDVIGADGNWTAILLGSYFLAGAAGMPVWVRLSGRVGLRATWLIGMAFAVIAFAGTLMLERGDLWPFLAICVVTGLTLGSDLALPPALLAETISRSSHGGRLEGSYFGIWNLATKLNLAVAAGLALPLLAAAGYRPGNPADGTLALSLAYAALPCAMKLVAIAMLVLTPPISHDHQRESPIGESA